MFLKKVIRSTTLEVDANIDELIEGLMEVQGRCECTYKRKTLRYHNEVYSLVFFYCLKNGSFVYSGDNKKGKNPLRFPSFDFFIRGKLYANNLDKTTIKIEYVRNNEDFLFCFLAPLLLLVIFIPLVILVATFSSFFISIISLYGLFTFWFFLYFIIDYFLNIEYRNINLANMQEDLFKKVKKITEDKNEIKHIL